MEIERKYQINTLPKTLEDYPNSTLRQGYIYTDPAIRIRQKDSFYFLTVKGQGLLVREEFELPISEQVFSDLQKKIDGLMIHKTRYYIPYNQFTIELDCFHDTYDGLIIAEVEFKSLEEAMSFTPPSWFGPDVTHDHRYQNSQMSKKLNHELITKQP